MNRTKMRECDRCNKYCFAYMFVEKNNVYSTCRDCRRLFVPKKVAVAGLTGSEMKLISCFIKKLNKEQLLYVSNMIFIERRNRK